jgi:hypothetical protein
VNRRGESTGVVLGALAALAVAVGCASTPSTPPRPALAAGPGVALPSPNLALACASRGEPLADRFEATRNDRLLGGEPPELPPVAEWNSVVVNRQDVLYGQTQATYRSTTRVWQRSP